MDVFSRAEPLLMIPGPVMSSREVLDILSQRTYAHTEVDFVKYYQHGLLNLRTIFDVSSEYTPVMIAGSGTLAMEIALLNLIDQNKDQQALICKTGFFGDRYATLARSLGVEYESISAPVGSGITAEQLNTALEGSDIDFAFIQHVDTSTGVANDIEMFGKICAEHDVVSVVDGVCALGGQEVYQEKWGIDIYLTGAQKALAVPPGLAILMYSPRAREISETRQDPVPGYYADLRNWWAIMDAYLGGQPKYFSTPATNMIAAMYRSTELILEEGMKQVYHRHQTLAERFRSEMEELGFDFITHQSFYANTLSTPKYLSDTDGATFRKKLLEHGVLVAGGIQPGIADTYFRVGHMGIVSEKEIAFTLDAIRTALSS
jgi:alanine-glyoxylate transaminase/serine-glyoxylate transaminase/serine-pyruvate transaminase